MHEKNVLPISPEPGEESTTIVPLKISARIFFLLNCIPILFFTKMSSILSMLKYTFQYESRVLDALLRLFYMDKESNFPTYFSSFLLLLASILLFYIFAESRLRKNQKRYYWAILSLIFLMMSMDEFLSLHERLMEPLRGSFNLKGWLYFAWIIPGFILVSIVGLGFLRFLLNLRPRIRNMFILAGAVFISGALGVEMIGGYLTYNFGQRNFLFAMTANLEETLEMLGVAYFNYAILIYIQKELKHKLQLLVSPKIVPSRF